MELSQLSLPETNEDLRLIKQCFSQRNKKIIVKTHIGFPSKFFKTSLLWEIHILNFKQREYFGVKVSLVVTKGKIALNFPQLTQFWE